MTDQSQREDSIDVRCQQEIEALHRFFEDWLGGTCPNTDAAFDRVRQALAPSFHLIHPEGRMMSRENILSGLRKNHGGHPDLTIQIRNVQLLQTGDDLLVATYEEWQENDATTDGRLSTVAFCCDAESPNGLRWQHVHETWLQTP